jgi:hypothetical protein
VHKFGRKCGYYIWENVAKCNKIKQNAAKCGKMYQKMWQNAGKDAQI